ncbi:MAG TPA: hypothetical protein VF912_18655 [Anaeromyxobacter sp.]
MNRRHLLVLVVGCVLTTAAFAQGSSTGGQTPESDKLEAAADNLARMKTSLKQVLGRAEQARNEKDVVKLNCVNEKLTQIKALIRVAEQADIALHESVAARDSTGDAAFSKIAIARTKVDGLRSESEQCIGQLAYMVDEKTTVEVEQPSNLPDRRVADLGLGLAKRQDNPADSVTQIGLGAGSDFGTGAYSSGYSSGLPFTPPPVIRPPVASPWR